MTNQTQWRYEPASRPRPRLDGEMDKQDLEAFYRYEMDAYDDFYDELWAMHERKELTRERFLDELSAVRNGHMTTLRSLLNEYLYGLNFPFVHFETETEVSQ